MTKIGAKLNSERKRGAKNKILKDKLLVAVNKVLAMKTPCNYQEYMKTMIKLRNYKITVSKMGEGYLKGIVVVTMLFKENNVTLEIREPKMRIELIDEFVKDRNKIINGEITKEIIDKYFD